MGKRVDVVILYLGVVFVIEFKVGEKSHSSAAIEQGLNYSVDLKNFHEQSHERAIVPLIVSTEAPAYDPCIQLFWCALRIKAHNKALHSDKIMLRSFLSRPS